MALLAVCLPIQPGKTEQWTHFIQELRGPRSGDLEASREHMHVRERTFLQHTPQGDFAIITLEGEHPELAYGSMGEGDDEFTHWFVEQVKECYDIDLTTAMPSPIPHQMVDSTHLVRV